VPRERRKAAAASFAKPTWKTSHTERSVGGMRRISSFENRPRPRARMDAGSTTSATAPQAGRPRRKRARAATASHAFAERTSYRSR